MRGMVLFVCLFAICAQAQEQELEVSLPEGAIGEHAFGSFRWFQILREQNDASEYKAFKLAYTAGVVESWVDLTFQLSLRENRAGRLSDAESNRIQLMASNCGPRNKDDLLSLYDTAESMAPLSTRPLVEIGVSYWIIRALEEQCLAWESP